MAWRSSACSKLSLWAAYTSRHDPCSAPTVVRSWTKSTSPSCSATMITIKIQTRSCCSESSKSGSTSSTLTSSTSPSTQMTLPVLRRSNRPTSSSSSTRVAGTSSRSVSGSRNPLAVSLIECKITYRRVIVVQRSQFRLEHNEGSRADGGRDQESLPEDEHPREMPQLEGVSISASLIDS